MRPRALTVAALVCLPALAGAAGVVGTGTPASCTEAAFNQALAGFGTVTFNCGGGPVVIPFTASKFLAASTTIDGAGQQITLDGGNATRLFETDYQLSSFTLTFRNLTLRNARGATGFGGAMRFGYQDFPTTVNIENVTFANNVSAQAGPDVGGGAFHVGSHNFVNVHNSTFTGNRGGNGGAIGQIGAILTVEDSSFTGNSTHAQLGGNGGAGGAIYIDGSSNSLVTIRRSSFVSNSSTGLGGAIHTYQYAGASGVVIEDSYFGGNSTVQNGGAVYHQNGTLAISRSTFEGNVTQGQGGALWLLQASTTTITNSTFVGNDAVGIPPNNGSSGLGGAILINASSNVTISHSTIAYNHADWVGGGICGGMGSSVTTLRGTIVAHNSADNGGNPWNIAHNCATQLVDGGFNLQFPTHANPSDPNDPNCTASIAIADPLLGPAGPNGGPTPTMALLTGSPARDAVLSGCPPPGTDQRGVSRPLGARCDIGAYEAEVNADLSIAISDSVDPVLTGNPLTYTLGVSNAGPAAATGVSVVDTLPASVAFASASPGCSNAAGTVTCGLGTLAAGASTNLSIGVTVTQPTGQIVNTASVSSVSPDPNAANNSDTETTAVSPADLSLSIADSADPVTPGSPFSYVLGVTNNGPAPATGVTLSNVLSPAVSFVSASPGCANASGTVTCAVGALGVGASASRSIDVTANNWGGAVDTASASAVQTDPQAANNTATEVTLFDLGLSKELVHGSDERLSLEALPGPLAREELFRIRRPPRTSWEIVVDGTSADVSGASGALDLQLFGSDLATVIRDSVAIGAGHSRSLRLVNSQDRDVVEQLVRVRSTGCTTTCGPEDVYRIRAWETTYRVARFNNSGTQATVLVVENTSSDAVAGTVWLWRGDGSLAASQAFSLAPHAVYTLNTSTLAPATGGSATINHDGRYGSLSGKAVAVEPATGFTFDSPLLPRLR